MKSNLLFGKGLNISIKFIYPKIFSILILSVLFLLFALFELNFGCEQVPRSSEKQSASEALRKKEALQYISNLPQRNKSIDLTQFNLLGGGGTHSIYQLDKEAKYLLKVMRRSIGKPLPLLKSEKKELEKEYKKLYTVFGVKHCLVEERFIRKIFISSKEKPTLAIVSVVRFEPAFLLKKKIGLNFASIEENEILIQKHTSSYHSMNLGLVGRQKDYENFDIETFLIFEPYFASFFRAVDKCPSLATVTRDFLIKYKIYLERTGRLLDLRGKDNVFFYKNGREWDYKVGSVIKHETINDFKRIMKKININPAVVKESFENWTLVFYVPSWIRGLNALTKKLEMSKIIDDISFSKKDSETLSKMHLYLSDDGKASYFARKGDFSIALTFFKKYSQHEKDHNTNIRFCLGHLYWMHIKNKKGEHNLTEVKMIQQFLKLLVDKKNQFTPSAHGEAKESIIGLLTALETLGTENYKELEILSKKMLKKLAKNEFSRDMD